MKKFLARIAHLFFNSIFFLPFVWIFKIVGKFGFGSDLCLRHGYLPMPVHFYSPVPDIEDLKQRKIWAKKSSLFGLAWLPQKQRDFLKKLGRKYSQECHWPLNPPTNSTQFYLNNNCFSFGCAASLHSMIRNFQPKNVIEIGSGHSSKIISQALKMNKNNSRYTIIDPYPPDYISQRKIKFNQLIKKRVELIDSKIFKSLKANDILFIDSSHSVKIGGDVNFLYLEILPRLKPGVIVHIHDIALPYEYPKSYAQSETFRQFWTEQYLLQSFLSLNEKFEILLAMNYLMTDYPIDFKKAFKFYNPEIHLLKSSSFWMKRKSL